MKKFLGLIFSVIAIKGFALSISPIDLEISAVKGQGYYTLTNDGTSQKVIAIITKSRSIDQDGKNIYSPTKDLIVYPKQVVLKAKEKRLIRIIWKAKKKISEEQVYRITFAEKNIDINFDEEDLGQKEQKAGVSFGIQFEGSIYIQPKKQVKANVEVTSYEKKSVEGEEYFVIMLENKGSKHKHMNTKDLEIELLLPSKDKKENWHLLSEKLLKKHLGGHVLLLAGGKRRIMIPCREKQIPENVLGVRLTE